MLRRTFLCVVILLCVALRLLVQTATPPAKPPASETITVPFARTSAPVSVIPLDVMVNGKGPYLFLLDTGAATNVITPDLAAELGIQSSQNSELAAGGKKTVQAGVTQLDRVQFGKAEITDTVCFLVALPPGLPFRGVLGKDVFKKYVVTVDYTGQRLRFADPAAFTYAGKGTALPLTFEGDDRRPLLTAAVDGIEGRFLVDTGNSGALTLHGGFVQANNLKKKYTSKLHITNDETVTGEQKVVVTWEPTVTLGKNVLSHVPTELQEPKGAADLRHDGNIGGDILRQFTVTFDYSHLCAYFEPNANYATPYPRNRSGLVPHYEASAFVIRAVNANSPASAAGLRVRDRIVKIDGKDAAQVDIMLLKALLEQPAGTAVPLTVQSGKKSREVTLVLKDYD